MSDMKISTTDIWFIAVLIASLCFLSSSLLIIFLIMQSFLFCQFFFQIRDVSKSNMLQ